MGKGQKQGTKLSSNLLKSNFNRLLQSNNNNNKKKKQVKCKDRLELKSETSRRDVSGGCCLSLWDRSVRTQRRSCTP